MYELARSPAFARVAERITNADAVYILGIQSTRGISNAFYSYLEYIRPRVFYSDGMQYGPAPSGIGWGRNRTVCEAVVFLLKKYVASWSLRYMFGNVAGIVTPIVIGYLVARTGSFNGALVFVGANALLTVISYLVIVKDIRRVELRPA